MNRSLKLLICYYFIIRDKAERGVESRWRLTCVCLFQHLYFPAVLNCLLSICKFMVVNMEEK